MRNMIKALAVACLGVGVGCYVYGNSFLPEAQIQIGANGSPGARGQFGFHVSPSDFREAATARGVGAGLITAGVIILLLAIDWTRLKALLPQSEPAGSAPKT